MNGWLAKCDLTIQGSRIDFDVTNLPLMLNETHLPPELLAGCKDDGGDIRFTDTDGATELAREILQCDKDAGTMLIYVRIPSLVAAADKVITVWWSNASASEPAESSASGSRTVWDDYYGVYHFQNMTAGLKKIKDSAGKWSSFSAIGEPAPSDGHVPNSTAATIDADAGFDCHESYFWGKGLKDFMVWQRPAIDGVLPSGVLSTSSSSGGPAFGYTPAGKMGISWTSYLNTAIDDSAWTHVLYQVGPDVEKGGVWFHNCNPSTNGGGILGKPDLYQYFGPMTPSTASGVKFSEMRITRDKTLPLNYYKVMLALESNPTGIVVPGTPETSSVKNIIKFTGLIPNTEVRIYERNSDGSAGDELAGVEDSLEEFSYEFEFSSEFDVIVRILHLDYIMITYEKITITGDMTIPVQQQFDRNFYDPF